MENINSVNVLSIDEEKLRFRIIIGIQAVGVNGYGRGNYRVNIPVPTSIANSNDYSACSIKIDSFTAHAQEAVVAASFRRKGAARIKVGGIEIRLGVPSSQTASVYLTDPASIHASGNVEVSGFRQYVPLHIVNLGTVAGPGALAGSYGWSGFGSSYNSGGILCGNIFGQNLNISFSSPTHNDLVYIVDGAGAQDVGQYELALMVTMIKNN